MKTPKMVVQIYEVNTNTWLNIDDKQNHNFGGFIDLAERLSKSFKVPTRVVAVEKNSIFNSTLWDSRNK